MSHTCTACGFSNPPEMRFCGGCGARLGTATATRPPHPDLPAEPRAERRQLTVMFCDLVDSTLLAHRLDPEELHALVQEYQRVCAEVVARLHGHVAQCLGDGLLVYFGFPGAHEDDAPRAVHSGLGMIAAVRLLNDRLSLEGGVRLAVRLGIHTGPVVTGQLGAGPSYEPLAVGSTPHLAARLQALAPPDGIALSAATHRLTGDFFACRPLGPQRLKGVPQPVEVYQVLGESGVHSRFEGAVRRGLSPLVGRAAELGRLRAAFAAARGGSGRVVVVEGEAGLGKSRLVHELAQELAGEPHVWWACQGSPYHQNSVLHPLLALIRRVAGCAADDPLTLQRRRLGEMLERYGLPRRDGVPLLSALLSLPAEERRGPSPQAREKTLELLAALFRRQAAATPLVFAVEDLHWVDPSTRELLDRLAAQAPACRLLAVLTERTALAPAEDGPPHAERLRLGRLADAEVEQIARHVAAGKPLSESVLGELVARTDGVPLFAEELTKMLLETGLLERSPEPGTPRRALAIPTTLEDSLRARLDRLGQAKEAAQLAAVIGREVPGELLRAVAPWDGEVLGSLLDRLVAAELLEPLEGTSPGYSFRHALIREAAYGSLLRQQRQDWHARLAATLEERFPALAAAQPELVAQHYTAAGRLPEAIELWRRAGREALRRAANAEAARHFETALDLLVQRPADRGRDELELELLTALGPPLMATRGFAAPAVMRVYGRARELCLGGGQGPRLFASLVGLCRFYTTAAQLDTARDLTAQLLRLAREGDDPDMHVEAYRSAGCVLFYRGEIEAARSHLERGIAVDLLARRRVRLFDSVYHAGLGCRAFLSWALWHLGYPDQAAAMSREGLALARRLGRPYDLTLALSAAALTHLLRREAAATRVLAEEQMALAAEHHLAIPLASGRLLCGGALVELGRVAEGMELMREGIAAWRATGALANLTFYHGALLAEGCRRAARPDEGLAVLAGALADADRHGERFFEAGLHQLQGELTLMRSAAAVDAAERCFLRALAVARRQRARALELRAATSLARLWARRGETRRARSLLAAVCRSFSEGLDTPDLCDAASLIAELDALAAPEPLNASAGT